jgi:hypothetical protein
MEVAVEVENESGGELSELAGKELSVTKVQKSHV